MKQILEETARVENPVKIYKFVDWEVPDISKIQDARAVKLRTLIDNGGDLARQDKNWITEHVNNNSYFKKAIPIRGWCVPFDDILTRFLVKIDNYWIEVYAVDKTSLIEVIEENNSDIEEIIEAPEVNN